MTTNTFASNELAEKDIDQHNADSPQASERTGVASSHPPLKRASDADFLTVPSANANVSRKMQRARGETRAPKSHNAFCVSQLPGADSREIAEIGCEKSARAHRSEILLRWWRFNLVGAIGILVQLGALFLLKSVFHFYYLAATVIAVETAVVHNFIWHEQFTWADRVRLDVRFVQRRLRSAGNEVRGSRIAASSRFLRLLRFNLTVGAVSIAGNLVLMKLMIAYGHMNYFAANVLAIALCSAMNFLISDEWVFC